MVNPSPGLRKPQFERPPERPIELAEVPATRPLGAPRWLPLLGRVFYSCLFIMASFEHFTQGYVNAAIDRGVPAASVLVPLAGVLALLGGLSVLFGLRARAGAWLLVLFLIPVTLMMHSFWNDTDPATAMANKIGFMKNLSMLGGALLIAYFGSGPLSLDRRRNTS